MIWVESGVKKVTFTISFKGTPLSPAAVARNLLRNKQLSVTSRPQQQGGGGVQRLSPQKQNGGLAQQRPSPQGGQ